MLQVVVSDTHFPMILSAIYQYCCHQWKYNVPLESCLLT